MPVDLFKPPSKTELRKRRTARIKNCKNHFWRPGISLLNGSIYLGCESCGAIKGFPESPSCLFFYDTLKSIEAKFIVNY